MKKFLLALLWSLAFGRLFAQSPKTYIAILPGYQLNAQSRVDTYGSRGGDSETYETKKKTAFAGSVDAAYYFTEFVAVHVGYFYGGLRSASRSVTYSSYLSTTDGHFNLVEIGPEFAIRLSEHALFYGQFNVGRAFAGRSTLHYLGRSLYADLPSEEWAGGAALGVRYFPSRAVGIAGQVNYHRINHWRFNDYWDARLGVVFRF